MSRNILPSQSTLKELLRYDADGGRLFWNERTIKWFDRDWQRRAWNTKWADKEAFTAMDGNGYRRGMVLGIQTSAHRVIWKIVTGEDADTVDHINGNTSDNRFTNLRSVKHSTNMKNLKLRSDNKSGICGVGWAKRDKKWRVNLAGKSLGHFSSFEKAVSARLKAEKADGYTIRKSS